MGRRRNTVESGHGGLFDYVSNPHGARPSMRPGPVERMNLADLPPDWREEYEERAAIMEYDGGLSRPNAEVSALSCVWRRWRESCAAER